MDQGLNLAGSLNMEGPGGAIHCSRGSWTEPACTWDLREGHCKVRVHCEMGERRALLSVLLSFCPFGYTFSIMKYKKAFFNTPITRAVHRPGSSSQPRTVRIPCLELVVSRCSWSQALTKVLQGLEGPLDFSRLSNFRIECVILSFNTFLNVNSMPGSRDSRMIRWA